MPYEMVSILWSNVRYAVNNLVDKTIVIRLGDVGSALTLCFFIFFISFSIFTISRQIRQN